MSMSLLPPLLLPPPLLLSLPAAQRALPGRTRGGGGGGGAPAGARLVLSRRSALLAAAPLLAAGEQLGAAPPAGASKLGGAVDSAWEAIGGGPADLFFPPEFLGTWDVVSKLVKLETPLGEDRVPNPASLQRAREADLGQPMGYQVSFMRNRAGRVIFDRRSNVASMMSQYYSGASPEVDFAGRIQWDPNDPNVLQLRMPGGLDVRTRVTRRSQDDLEGQSRIETSEYIEQV